MRKAIETRLKKLERKANPLANGPKVIMIVGVHPNHDGEEHIEDTYMAMIMGCPDNINSEDYANLAAFHASVSAKVEEIHGEPWVPHSKFVNFRSHP